MLSPKRTKYRKAHKGRIHGLAKAGYTLNFGAYGLKALTRALSGDDVLQIASNGLSVVDTIRGAEFQAILL